MKTQIHIVIDGNEANVKNRVGSNMYAFELIKAIHDVVVKRQNLRVTVLLANDKLSDLPQENDHWSYQVVKPAKFWTQWALPIHLFWNKNKYDVLFTPGHYAPRLTSIPYISSVMDLAFIYYPEQFRKSDLIQLTKWTKYSVRNAAKVLTISRSTQSDVMSEYGKKEEDTFVAYPSLPQGKFNPPAGGVSSKFKIEKKFKIKNPYLLYVGTLQPRKNIIKMIEAFELLAEDDKKLDLVIAGKIGWLADEILEKVKNSKNKNQIRMIGYVSEEEKSFLYQSAKASLLVGLYEGFGIPPLESMAHGVIPIVSNSSSLPEVIGEAGILVDENDIHSIAEGVKLVLDMTVKQKAVMKRKMREQVKKFSWMESAKKVLDELIMIVNL